MTLPLRADVALIHYCLRRGVKRGEAALAALGAVMAPAPPGQIHITHRLDGLCEVALPRGGVTLTRAGRRGQTHAARWADGGALSVTDLARLLRREEEV